MALLESNTNFHSGPELFTKREEFEDYFAGLAISADQLLSDETAYSTAVMRVSRYILFFHREGPARNELLQETLYTIDAVYAGTSEPESLAGSFTGLMQQTHKALGIGSERA